MSSSVPTSFSAYQCAQETKHESIERICDFWRRNGSVPINQQRDTLLHFLVVFGNVAALEALFRRGLVTNEELAMKNVNGDTALHEAARFGKRDFVDVMVNKEQGLVFGLNNMGETPLFVAAASGNEEVFWQLLQEFHSDCFARREDGSTVLHAAINGGYYRIDPIASIGLNTLRLRSASLFMLKHLGRTASPVLQLIGVTVYFCIPALYVEARREINVDDSYASRVVINRVQRSFIVSILLGRGWLQDMDNEKQKHVLALALAKRLIEEERDWTHYIDCSRTSDFSVDSLVVANPLLEATKHDLEELAIEILRKYPNAANSLDKHGRNILHIAVRHKCRQVYQVFMKNVAHKDRMIADVDYYGNTILHLATNRGRFPNFPMTNAHQMTWDVYWFKIMTRESYPHQWCMRNKDGKTAEMLFKENYSVPLDRAEKTSKDMIQGLMVVSTLIGAISITTLLTILGGFDEDDGHPVLQNTYRNEMQSFFIYIWLALFASIFSLGGLLSIQVSAFHMDDFYLTLPLQFLVASTALLYSTFYTVTTFTQAYILVTPDKVPGRLVQSQLGTLPCILMGAFYVDQMYLTVLNLYEVVYYSFAYQTPKL